MFLSELAACVDGARLVCGEGTMQYSERTEVRGLTADSRFCSNGDVFFCLTGGKLDSHIYASDAEGAGAAAVVSERELELKIPQIIVPDTRRAMGLMGNLFYGRAAEKLKIIGITGTNGKTTTSHMLASVLRRAGKNTGIIGTLGIFYGKKQIAPELTTPDPLFLHKILADMLKDGIEYVVMEVSAHAIFYRKDTGIRYTACIFTNLTQDHLDFFENMENYKNVKKRLFTHEKSPIAVINCDDESGREIISERLNTRAGKNTKTVAYGLENPADIFAVSTSETLRVNEFVLNLSDELCRITLPMTGRHNVYNAMAAAGTAYTLGISTEAISEGLSGMSPVKGRLEHAGKIRGADIFVDFAHTPDGLEKSLSALKVHCKGRLICLFGCGGNRDKTKRPIMGETVARGADYSVITSDNPRFEDPNDIIADIEKGYRKVSSSYVVITERDKAIRYAVSKLSKGDVLLVAGKGGEDYQEIMGIKYAYNDYAVIREAITKA